MTQTADTNVIRSTVASDFYNAITVPINNLPKWHSGSNPGGVTQPGIAAGSTVSTYTPSPLTSNLLSSTTVSTQPTTADIATGSVSLGSINLLFRTTAQILSRARNTRLMKYYGNSTVGLTLVYDQTSVAHLNSSWQLALGSIPSLTSTDLDASEFNTYITTLDSTIAAHRATTVTFTETWCHSNCHSNHSSRSRR